MAFLDKLKFWKHGEEPPKEKWGEELGLPKPEEIGGLAEKDTTKGLGGTPSLEEKPEEGPMPQEEWGIRKPGEMPPEEMGKEIEIKGPGHEEVEAQAERYKERLTPTVLEPSTMREYPHPELLSKNLEVVSSKLDVLKASLESINQRLAHLEKLAESESTKKRYSW